MFTLPSLSLISTMLVVDPVHRSSLEQVAKHPWLMEGHEMDPIPLPAISDVGEIPPDDFEVILHRMEMGGYGTKEDILK